MKTLLRKAQSDSASQIQESGIKTDGPAVARMIAIGSLALASAFSMVSPAQAQQNTGNILVNAAGGIGQVLGQQAGQGQNMGNEFGKILGIGLGTVAKVVTGQQVNGSDVGGTLGQVTGAVVGYKLAGNSATSKTIGVLIGSAGGAILGANVGNTYDMNKANEQTAAIPLNAQDQQDFIQGMRNASAKIQSKPQTQNGQGTVQISPNQVGFNAFMSHIVQRTKIPMFASGNQQMPDEVMLAVSNKAMEVVKVGKAYERSTNDWDSAFLQNKTPAVKTEINNSVVLTGDLLAAKTREYIQVRNAAAAQGFDVSVVDGSVADNLKNLRVETNYGFAIKGIGSRAPGYQGI